MARDEDRERKRRLSKMMPKLQEINPEEILPYLHCLSDMRKEKIRANLRNDGPMVAAGELFEQLPKRENWYRTLVNALKKLEYEKLADELEGPEKKSHPSESSQIAAGQTSHNASVNQIQGGQQSPPATNPHPSAIEGRPLEAEASVSPGFPVTAAEKDTPHKEKKSHPSESSQNAAGQTSHNASVNQIQGGQQSPPGVEKDTNQSGPEENPGQQSPSGASLPVPMQERRQEASAPDLQSRESGSGGLVASSPSSDQRRHGGSESDECNISPNERPIRMRAEETAALKSGNSSPTAASGARISVRPRDSRPAGRENAGRRTEGDVESGGERQRRESREEGRDKVNFNFQSPPKNLNIFKDPERKTNNLSPTEDVQEFYRKKENKHKFESPNVAEDRDDICPTGVMLPLSSLDTVDRQSRQINDISYRDILISSSSSQGGSYPRQTDEGKVSIRGVQGAREGGNRNDVSGAGGIDAATDNQDSLVMRYGNIVRGYIPGMLNYVGDRMLCPP